MENQEVVKYEGKDMTAGGENGPFYDQGESAITGFYGRKWLNPDPSFAAGEGKSAQPFILMRYAEVLLNAAEASNRVIFSRSNISRWRKSSPAWQPKR